HRRVVVGRHVHRRHDLLRQHAAERAADLDRLEALDGRKAGADRLARLVDAQRVRVVAVEAADRVGDLHSRFSSSSVLMFRKASGWSSKSTSTCLSDAYHASILRPPFTRNV